MFSEELSRLMVRDRARKRRVSIDELFGGEVTGLSNEEPLFIGPLNHDPGIRGYVTPELSRQIPSSQNFVNDYQI